MAICSTQFLLFRGINRWFFFPLRVASVPKLQRDRSGGTIAEMSWERPVERKARYGTWDPRKKWRVSVSSWGPLNHPAIGVSSWLWKSRWAVDLTVYDANQVGNPRTKRRFIAGKSIDHFPASHGHVWWPEDLCLLRCIHMNPMLQVSILQSILPGIWDSESSRRYHLNVEFVFSLVQEVKNPQFLLLMSPETVGENPKNPIVHQHGPHSVPHKLTVISSFSDTKIIYIYIIYVGDIISHRIHVCYIC